MIKFLDLSIKSKLSEKLAAALAWHLNNGRFIEGKPLSDFEKNITSLMDKIYCVGVGSGTDALTLAIKSLNLPPGSKIITTPFSWIASSTSILLAGHQPVFSGLMDDLSMNISSLPDNPPADWKALLLVHLHGLSADAYAAKKYCEKHNIILIEDCAQSFFVRDIHGEFCGTYGDLACFSFNPMKIFGALGDAGAVITNNSTYNEKLIQLRHSGIARDGEFATLLSNNCRLDSLQASFLSILLEELPNKIENRKIVADFYDRNLHPKVKAISRTYTSSPNYYVYQTFVESRDDLTNFLSENGIETKIRHNFLITDHPLFHTYKIIEPINRAFLNKHLCLPLHENMTIEDANFVTGKINEFYK